MRLGKSRRLRLGDSKKKHKKKKENKGKLLPLKYKKRHPTFRTMLAVPACPYGHDLKLTSRAISCFDTKFYGESIRFCKECNCYYTNNSDLAKSGKVYMESPIHYSDQLLVKNIVNHTVVSYSVRPCWKDSYLDDGRLPDLTKISRYKAVYVYAEKCTCKICFNRYRVDTIIDKTANVSTKAGKMVEINIQYCDSCGQFFMNYESLKAYQKIYGELDIRLLYSSIDNDEDGDSGFAYDSILSRNGYSVRKGIPRTTRQRVLRRILDENISTKHEIIKLLTQFIKIGKNRFPDACRRWQEDILFVNQYHIDDQENVGVMKLEQGGRIKRDR